MLYFFHSGQVVYLWSLKSLFSKDALKKLEIESECAEVNRETKQPCNKNDPIIKNFRTINGECNNLHHRKLGASATRFLRIVNGKYFDPDLLNDPIGFPGQSSTLSSMKPVAFNVVAGIIVEQKLAERRNTLSTHALMQFGQFLDHDLDLAPENENSGKCGNVRYDISSL